MTADPIRAERDRMRAEALGRQLIALGRLLVEGAVPLPSTTLSVSYYLRGEPDEQQTQAASIARALGGEWRARPRVTAPRYASVSSYPFVYETLADGTPYGPGSIEYTVNVDLGEPEAPVLTADEQLAAAMNSTVDDDRQARVAAVGGPDAEGDR